MIITIILLLFLFAIWLFIRKPFKSKYFVIELNGVTFIYLSGDYAKFEMQQVYSDKDIPYLCRADRQPAP